MQNENKLTQSQTQSATVSYSRKEISKSLAFAMQRCDSLDLNVEATATDIRNEFMNKLDLKEIIKAIKSGAMGKYGVNE